MIKRTLCFENPAYLSTTNEQLVVQQPGLVKPGTIPIEDIGFVLLENPQITITHCTIQKLVENNVALITCNGKHHPIGMMLNLHANTLQSLRFRQQLDASVPLKKQLWQQTIKAKIANQAALLTQLKRKTGNLATLAKNVKSGDAGNCEAQAAVHYWKNLFGVPDFYREQFGDPPNHLLNYGYTILRALMARALVGSGLHPTLGIFHKNQYNAYCLADDVMEPYRPFVDRLVAGIFKKEKEELQLTPAAKKQLLNIPVLDVEVRGKKSPLMVAASQTTASLAKSFEVGEAQILYPQF